MRVTCLRAALCGIVLGTAACDDGLSTGTGGGPGGGGRGLSAPASVNRFGVEVRASGSFRPGQPIQITVTGRANLRSGDARVRLVLPEVAAARRAGWERMDYGEDGSVEPELMERHGMSRGQSLTRTASITIPKPGYYQVVASIVQEGESAGDERPAGGELVQNAAHDEIWLWISESGGRATDGFEAERIPAQMHRVPGPLTPLSQAPPATGTETSPGPRPSRRPANAGVAEMSHTGYAGWVDLHAMYWNNDVGALRPIPNARYEYLIYNRLGTYVRTEPAGTTGPDGLTFVQCYSDANGHGKYRLRVMLDNERVTMAAPLVIDTQLRDFATTCGTAGNVEATGTAQQKERSHVFWNLDRAIRSSDAFFGLQRADITVRLDASASYSTYEWHTTAKHLVIATNPAAGFGDQIWGTFGAFVHAHEYGHAYQEDVLGGVKRYYYTSGGAPVCGQSHPMQNQTNLQCALAEGFPDYYAVAVLGSATGSVLTDMESGRYSPGATNQWGIQPGADGSTIQGAVASFLYDITDPANETHDQTQYPGRYVADIIRTCQVWNGAWRMNDGVDHVAYCFLGTIYDTHQFTTRPTPPTSHTEGATEPEAYETRYFKIRKNYQKNLFGLNV